MFVTQLHANKSAVNQAIKLANFSMTKKEKKALTWAKQPAFNFRALCLSAVAALTKQVNQDLLHAAEFGCSMSKQYEYDMVLRVGERAVGDTWVVEISTSGSLSDVKQDHWTLGQVDLSQPCSDPLDRIVETVRGLIEEVLERTVDEYEDAQAWAERMGETPDTPSLQDRAPLEHFTERNY